MILHDLDSRAVRRRARNFCVRSCAGWGLTRGDKLLHIVGFAVLCDGAYEDASRGCSSSIGVHLREA